MSNRTSPELPMWRDTDEQTFQNLVEVHRREIQFHCYRMLGSVHDAEDLVQETLIRALRGRNQFEGRGSLRAWLYRIATNACLNSLSRREIRRRVLPDSRDHESDAHVEAAINNEVHWLEPYPDTALDGIADTAPDPSAKYEMRETVRLAFVAAIQYLPPRQRAVVLLRDAMGWSAEEAAQTLDISLASANSALQRARATLAQAFPTGLSNKTPTLTEHDQALLERYVQAWEAADLDSLVAVLKRDAVLNMPPFEQWYRGRDNIRLVLAKAWALCHIPPFRVIATSANQQPAFALYSFDRSNSEFKAVALNLIEFQANAIGRLHFFFDPSLFPSFGLPVGLPA